MATPGWYPDPGGQQGAFRYWDGRAWGQELRGEPGGPPPGSTSPSPFEQPTRHPGTSGGQPPQWQPSGVPSSPPSSSPSPSGPPTGGWSTGPAAQPSWQQSPDGSRGGGGRTALLAVLALLLVAGLGVGSFFVVRSLTDDDPGEAAPTPSISTPVDPESTDPEPTDPDPTDPEPTVEPTEPTRQQCTGGNPTAGIVGAQGGRWIGGGLQMRQVRGFDPESNQGPAFEFATGVFAPSRLIEQTEDAGWVALYALGGLPTANGFGSLQQAAESVMACMAGSETFYQDFSGRTDLVSEAVTVDGAEAWRVTAEVRIDSDVLSVEGDHATVIVVDTGDPNAYGLFVSVVPLGDDALIAEQDEQLGRIRVR